MAGVARSDGTPRAPQIPASMNLDAWLDDEAWVLPVPKPLRVRGLLVEGSDDESGWGAFSPSSAPWCATDLAHVASSLNGDLESPPLVALQEVERFANRYGLPATWPAETPGRPAVSMLVPDFLADAAEVRSVLLAYKAALDDDSMPVRVDASDPYSRFLADMRQRLRIHLSHGKFRDGRHAFTYFGPAGELISVGEVVRFQLLADFLAGRPVRRCAYGPCGRFFIWSRTRTSGGKTAKPPKRSNGLRGVPAQFCSYSHAQMAQRTREG